MTKNPWVEEETFYRAYVTENVTLYGREAKTGDIWAESVELDSVLRRSMMVPVRIVKVQTWIKRKAQEKEIWSSEGKWPDLQEIESS